MPAGKRRFEATRVQPKLHLGRVYYVRRLRSRETQMSSAKVAVSNATPHTTRALLHPDGWKPPKASRIFPASAGSFLQLVIVRYANDSSKVTGWSIAEMRSMC